MAKLNIMDAVRRLGGLVRAGFQFNGARDMYQVFGYPRSLDFASLAARYARQDIAKRIVDKPADGLWTNPPVLKAPSAGSQKIIDDLTQRLMLYDVINRADKLAAMGRYSTILIGIDDGKGLNEPVTPSEEHKVIYLQPYSYEALKVESLVNETKDKRFGKPLMYHLQPGVDSSGTGVARVIKAAPALVHWSRVVHIADSALEDETCGFPRLGVVNNLLDDLLKTGGGSAEIYWLNARGGLHIDVDKDMDLEPADEAALTDEVSDYTNQLARVMRTRGVKITPINSNNADPRQSFQVTLALLSAATGIPQRILVGAEAGQLASEQDRANWSVFVNERRQNFGVPRVLRPLFACLIAMGLFRTDEEGKVEVIWPEAFILSPLERAQTNAQQARSAANVSKTLTQTPSLLSLEEGRSIISLGEAKIDGPPPPLSKQFKPAKAETSTDPNTGKPAEDGTKTKDTQK